MSSVEASDDALAWRVLATLEGGALALAAAAFFASIARKALVRSTERDVDVKDVIISSESTLGLDIKRRLEEHGCAVSVATSGAMRGRRWRRSAAEHSLSSFDAVVIIGAETEHSGLDAMSRLVTEDINYNIETLQSLSKLVRPGGRLLWVSRASGASSGAFSGAKHALDGVIKAQLTLIANTSQCEAVFVSPSSEADVLAERTIAALLPRVHTPLQYSRFSLRNAMAKLVEYFTKGLKIIS